MALLVGFAVVALLLFMVAELVFGPALAIVLTGLCGLGLGGGPGFAAGIIGGLVGLVGSAVVRTLLDGLRPSAGSSGVSPSAAPPCPAPQWPTQPPPAPHFAPDASALPTPLQNGYAPDPTSWEARPTPLAERVPVPDERPRYGAEPRKMQLHRVVAPPPVPTTKKAGPQ